MNFDPIRVVTMKIIKQAFLVQNRKFIYYKKINYIRGYGILVDYHKILIYK